jgi:hypothetical protein
MEYMRSANILILPLATRSLATKLPQPAPMEGFPTGTLLSLPGATHSTLSSPWMQEFNLIVNRSL